MKKIGRLMSKYRIIVALCVVCVLATILLTGCSLGTKSSGNATPTPATSTITQQMQANISRIDAILSSALTRLSSVEGSISGISSINTRMTALENSVSAINISSLQTCVTNLQTQVSQLQVDLALANSRINTLQAYINGSGGGGTGTPTPTPSGTTTPTGLTVTVTPLFSGAVKDEDTYDYTFSVKNNYTSAKTFKLVVDYLANTQSANVNTSNTVLTSFEVVGGFTSLFSPSTGNGCGLVRFTSGDLVIAAGNTMNINGHFNLDYNGAVTTVWSCSVTTQ